MLALLSLPLASLAPQPQRRVPGTKAEAKAWKTIWSAGQGVTTIENDLSVKALAESLKEEFIYSINEQINLLDTYN